MSGNALHGPLVHGQIPNPLPWWAELVGSSVPALTLVGAGHAMYLMLAVRRTEGAPVQGEIPAKTRVVSPAKLPLAKARRNTPNCETRPGRPPVYVPPPAMTEVVATMRSEGKEVTAQTLATELGVSERSARRYLAALPRMV